MTVGLSYPWCLRTSQHSTSVQPAHLKLCVHFCWPLRIMLVSLALVSLGITFCLCLNQGPPHGPNFPGSPFPQSISEYIYYDLIYRTQMGMTQTLRAHNILCRDSSHFSVFHILFFIFFLVFILNFKITILKCARPPQRKEGV